MAKEFLRKATARQVLIRNFGSLERAKEKLGDIFLLASFNASKAPLTLKTIRYLEALGYEVALLRNVCQDCGVSYAYSNLATDNYCMLCSNKSRYKHEMITEPETLDELLHNLRVLQKHFDTPEDQTNTELIAALELDRDQCASRSNTVL